MVATILGAFRVGEIRNKVLFTGAILALYRLGAYIPAPGINAHAVNAVTKSLGSNGIFCLKYPDHEWTRSVQELARKVIGNS